MDTGQPAGPALGTHRQAWALYGGLVTLGQMALLGLLSLGAVDGRILLSVAQLGVGWVVVGLVTSQQQGAVQLVCHLGSCVAGRQAC